MKKLVKLSAILVVAAAFVCMLCMQASAAELSDIKNHWSKQYVEYGVQKGYISGYEDSTFRPDKIVTRAEFSKMINTAVGLTKTESITFKDIKTTDWFYNEVRKAVSAGYVSGYSDGAFLPNNVISRQEAAVILSRITLPVSDVSVSADKFADADKIGDWAVDAIEQMLEKKYFSGDDNNRFLPQDGLTRGQAAKIIYMFLSNENIRVSDYSVDGKEGKLSEVLFVGNVTIKDSTVEFDGCRVLGTVTLSGKKANTKFTNTAAKDIVNNSTDNTVIELDKDSSAKEVSLNYAADVSGDNIQKVILCGSDLLSGTVELSGDIDQVVIQKDAVIKIYDKVQKITLEKPVSVIVQSGKIAEFEVGSSAKNSSIVLSKDVEIDKASVNAVAAFTGTGTIKEANNAVSGISYEVKPEKVTGKPSVGDGEEGGLNNPSITPKNTATDVSRDTYITISFDEQLYDEDGKEVTLEYINKIILFTKSSAEGTDVDFTASLTNGKKITIKPKNILADKTKYYVTIIANKLFNENGDSNAVIRSYFTTEDSGVISGIKFAPANKETDVLLDTNITLSFEETMYKASGSALTEAYIKSSVVQLRKGSATGELVDFEVELNSNKKITIIPDRNLEPGTKYYIVVLANSIANKDKAKNTKTTSYFETSKELFVDITPENASTGNATTPEIKIDFSEALVKPNGSNASINDAYIEDLVVELHERTASGEMIPFEASISSDKKTITIVPTEELKTSTKYYIIINEETVKGKTSGSLNKKISSTFTTASNMSPIITPVNQKKDVSTDTQITLKFGSELYTKGTTSNPSRLIDVDYLIENEVVLLRRTTQSGTKIACDIEIIDGGKTIVLTPEEVLDEDTKYYVVLKKQTLYNAEKKYNSAATTYFTTARTLIPEFVPSNEDVDVDVNADIQVIFHENVYTASGDAVTTAYLIDEVLRLYKGTSANGTPVDFTVSISSDKRTFTLNPTDSLAGLSSYYVEVVAGSLTNVNEIENPKASIIFATDEAAVKEIIYTPANKATGVSVSATPTIEFESKIYKVGGGNVDNDYVQEHVKLREKTSSGAIVEADVTISSDKKTITITPAQDLKSNTKYYIVLASGKFQYSSSSKITVSTKPYFTTGTDTAELKSFEEVETLATTATFEFESNVAGKLHIIATPASGDPISFEKDIVAGKDQEVQIDGLKTDTSYTVKAYVQIASGAKSETITVSITTLEAFELEVIDYTDTTASIKVTANESGKLTITYNEQTYVSDISIIGGKSKTFEIDGLDANTQYNITVTFICNSDEVITDTVNVFTEDSSYYLVPESITVEDSEGEVYHPELEDGEAIVHVLGEEWVKVKVVVNENATLKINGATVASGRASSSINLDENGQATISIEVSYNGNTETYTLTIE